MDRLTPIGLAGHVVATVYVAGDSGRRGAPFAWEVVRVGRRWEKRQ